MCAVGKCEFVFLLFIYLLLTDIFAFINNDLKKGGRLIPNKLGLVLVQGQFNFVMSQHLFLQCFDVNLVLCFFSSHIYSSHFCLFSRIPSNRWWAGPPYSSS
jgi:hypothetical protein